MKAVILSRHAKASPKDLPIPDKDRPLRLSGKRDLLLLREALLGQSIRPEHIFSSTANRAAQTATILAGFYGVCDGISFYDDLFHNDRREMHEFIKQVDDEFEKIMLVGHNPELEELADLLRGDDQDTALPTSACLCLSFDVDVWDKVDARTGRLEFLEYPKKYKKEVLR